MDKMDEILEVLRQIQDDMGQIAAGRLKKPEVGEPDVSGVKIEAKPMNSEEAKEELAKAIGKDEEGNPEEEIGEEEEILPRWKQRLKKGI